MAELNVVRIDWQGERVTAEVIRATRWGMDSVMSDCVRTAKQRCPIGHGPRRSGAGLQGSIQMRPTTISGDQLTGYWGSYSVKYARWVEEGTQPHVILPKTKKALFWPGADHPVRMVNHPGTKARPYLVPTAQQLYPSLPFRIRAELEWGVKK